MNKLKYITITLILITLNSCKKKYNKYKCKTVKISYNDVNTLKNEDFIIIDNLKFKHTSNNTLIRKGIAIASSYVKINGITINTNSEIVIETLTNMLNKQKKYKISNKTSNYQYNKSIIFSKKNSKYISIYTYDNYSGSIECLE